MAASKQPQPQDGGSSRKGKDPQQPPLQWEFTKKKNWENIMFGPGMLDTISVVLSPTGQIWYTTIAMTEMLGWDQRELIDTDFTLLMTEDDIPTWHKNFGMALRGEYELFTYALMKNKNETYVLPDNSTAYKEHFYEITGRPFRFDGDTEIQCFFINLMPYPSPARAFLNSYLELKVDNMNLNAQVAQMKAEQEAEMATSTDLSKIVDSSDLKISMSVPSNYSDDPYSAARELSSTAQQQGNGTSTFEYFMEPGSAAFISENAEDGGRKRKLKKILDEPPMYLCHDCGRTDSPEWRKGPAGPKTLCNACGLRYAKKVKKNEETSMRASQSLAREAVKAITPPVANEQPLQPVASSSTSFVSQIDTSMQIPYDQLFFQQPETHPNYGIPQDAISMQNYFSLGDFAGLDFMGGDFMNGNYNPNGF